MPTQVATFRTLPAAVLDAVRQNATEPLDFATLLRIYDVTEDWLFSAVERFHRPYLLRQLLPLAEAALGAGQPASVVPSKAWSILRMSHLTNRQGALHLLDVLAASTGEGPGSRKGLSARLIEELEGVARLSWFLSNISVFVRAGFGTARLNPSATGVDVVTTVSIDTPGYMAAIADFFDGQRQTNESSATLEWLLRQRNDAPPRWEAIDAAYLRDNGHSLRDMMSGLLTISRLRTPPQNSSIAALAEGLRAFAGISAYRAASTIEALQFDGSRAEIEPFKQRERASRLMLRPLLRNGPASVWVLPQLATNALLVIGGYFDRSLTPWPEPQHIVPEADKLIKDAEAERNLAFEGVVCDALAAIGFIARRNVRALPGIRVIGDIDVLAARHTRDGGEIVVVEAKDPIQVYSPSQVVGQLGNFKEWIRKHDRRVQALSTPAGRRAVENRFGVSLPSPTVLGRVVTRMPAVASFHPSTSAQVSGLNEFIAELASRSAPLSTVQLPPPRP